MVIVSRKKFNPHYGQVPVRHDNTRMKAPMAYTASKLLTGDLELLRQHSFTRWMSRDLTQAAVDFCRNLGLVPAYAECSPDHLTRYLFWRITRRCPK